MQPNYNPANIAIQLANTSINIQSLSPKQLLGECIDIATQMFKELLANFLQVNKLENPFGQQKADFSLFVNYILEPSRLQQILEQYVKKGDKSLKTLVKSWIFELKYFRNCWAHSEQISQRFARRSFDTLSLIYSGFGGSSQSPVFQKIEFYRKTLLISEARSYVH